MQFIGLLSRADYLARVRTSNVLLYPSLHQPGAFVIIEAMATCKPVVCLDLGEPALLVNEKTGIRVPANSPDQVVHDVAAALSLLAHDPALCARMGQAGRERVLEHFTWDTKANSMCDFYEQAASNQ